MRAFRFENILDQTHEDCHIFVLDKILESIKENSRDVNEIDENEFYNSIREVILTIQKQAYEDIK